MSTTSSFCKEAEENAPDENTTAFKLDSINLSIRAGSLVALVGPTASGKTSFLRAILGEMPLASSAGGVQTREMAIYHCETRHDRRNEIVTELLNPNSCRKFLRNQATQKHTWKNNYLRYIKT
eukprot:250661-Amphidinium_carterae.2